jgi:hypothetical protein
VNDVSKLAPGKARLVVRHTAAAPAVDVRAGGQPVFKNLTNPNEAKADLAAGTVGADVVLAGTTTVAIPAANLNLAEGRFDRRRRACRQRTAGQRRVLPAPRPRSRRPDRRHRQ